MIRILDVIFATNRGNEELDRATQGVILEARKNEQLAKKERELSALLNATLKKVVGQN